MIFLEYFIVPLSSVFFSGFIKSTNTEKEFTFFDFISDFIIDINIVVGLTYMLFGIGVLAHHDEKHFVFFGWFGIAFGIFNYFWILAKFRNNQVFNFDEVSERIFGYNSKSIFSTTTILLTILFLYVFAYFVTTLPVSVYLMIVIFAFFSLIVIFTPNIFNVLLKKLLRNKIAPSFESFNNNASESEMLVFLCMVNDKSELFSSVISKIIEHYSLIGNKRKEKIFRKALEVYYRNIGNSELADDIKNVD